MGRPQDSYGANNFIRKFVDNSKFAIKSVCVCGGGGGGGGGGHCPSFHKMGGHLPLFLRLCDSLALASFSNPSHGKG